MSMDNVVIQEGPRRNVRHVRSSPAVEERYLVLGRFVTEGQTPPLSLEYSI